MNIYIYCKYNCLFQLYLYFLILKNFCKKEPEKERKISQRTGKPKAPPLIRMMLLLTQVTIKSNCCLIALLSVGATPQGC